MRTIKTYFKEAPFYIASAYRHVEKPDSQLTIAPFIKTNCPQVWEPIPLLRSLNNYVPFSSKCRV